MKNIRLFFISTFATISMLVCAAIAFAEESMPSPLPSPEAVAAAVPTILSKIEAFFAGIPTEGMVITVVAGLMEFAMRMIKTEKPRSMIFLASDLLKVIGNGLVKLGMVVDKVLPQRVK